jgi:hypothetical protein
LYRVIQAKVENIQFYSIERFFKTSSSFPDKIRKSDMRSITELFEFLRNCDKEALLKEFDVHCDCLIQKVDSGTKYTEEVME